MTKNRKNLWGLLFFTFLVMISIFLTVYCHKNSGYYNWKSEIWADKAGYYIYLPSTFMYHFDASKAPAGIDEKTGYGFTIDRENNKIITKYTYGVAALLSPFFILARIISPVFHLPGEAGFGPGFHFMVNMAAVFYMFLGLLFLKKFLEYYFKEGVVYILLFLVFAGTNLFFYTVNDTLMSHVYSFFLFALFLFSMKRFLATTENWLFFILMCAAFAMAVLIRPTNAILLLLYFTWDCEGLKDIMYRLRLLLRADRLILFLSILFVVFLPQMLYWDYSRGSFLTWSYTNEGFSNWKHPKIFEVWFSTLNGLFLYSPMVLLMVAGMIIMIVKKIRNGWLTLGLFLLISYVFSSWYNWYYGCSYGQRSYIEYYTVLIIPFGFFITEIPKITNLLFRYLLILVVVAFSYYNVKMSLEFDKCFFGSTWDWAQFGRQLDKAHIFIKYKKSFAYRNDFENVALTYPYTVSDSVHRSGMMSAHILPDREYTTFYALPVNNFGEQIPHVIKVGFHALNPGRQKVEATLVCSMDVGDSSIVWQPSPLPPLTDGSSSWQKAECKFIIPEEISREAVIKIYLWNPKRSSFYIDDLNIDFE